MEYKIGMIGCGTVGRGLMEILLAKGQALKDSLGFEARVVAVTDKLKGSLLVPEGIDLNKILAILAEGRALDAYPGGQGPQSRPLLPLEMIETCEADIIAEMTYTDIKTGEPATGYIEKALRSGKHVVTSNKGPAALHYHALRKLAEQNNRAFRFEGTVMSGTPVFGLFECGLSGNEVREIRGILNGTTNFILTKMEEDGMEYADALKLAQTLGYAEADPTADVEGFDALAKVVILSNVLLGASIKPADLRPEGISRISRADVLQAKKEGYRYKLIGFSRRVSNGVEAGVSPQKVPLSDPLAGVMGAHNALTFDLDLMGKVTISGPGAGKTETGFSILSDMLAIHRRFGR